MLVGINLEMLKASRKSMLGLHSRLSPACSQQPFFPCPFCLSCSRCSDRPFLDFQITTTFPKDPVYTFSISQNPFPIENRDVLGETQVSARHRNHLTQRHHLLPFPSLKAAWGQLQLCPEITPLCLSPAFAKPLPALHSVCVQMRGWERCSPPARCRAPACAPPDKPGRWGATTDRSGPTGDRSRVS